MPLGSLILVILGLIFGLHSLVEIAGGLELTFLTFRTCFYAAIPVPCGINKMDVSQIMLISEVATGWITIMKCKSGGNGAIGKLDSGML